jgi:glutamate N-acetyltransferase/amino-acid N-acetyltransferase
MTLNLALLRRFSSTIPIKPTPSNLHLHQPIADAYFPKGYLLTGINCGIKAPQKLDLGIILSTSQRPTSAAACFTRHAFKAAPILVSEDVLKANNGRARAVVVNSGCANAVTGKQGMEDAWAMVRATDALLENNDGTETLVMSTGVIGQKLPMSKILAGISSQQRHTPTPSSSLGSTFEAWERVARAFVTTDTFPKLRARKFSVRGREFRIAGICKGAGMIHPDMGPPSSMPHATLLSCVLTDAPISPRSLQSALVHAVDRSFNSISIDGDMSTNDTIAILANGAGVQEAEMEEIDQVNDAEGYDIFRNELTALTTELAQLVVRDGEGATKFVTVSVEVSPSLLPPS